ncbi:hypothetical protein FHX05_005731 [Rhizobium sp. BK491]|nr:hypothetical protein [Rhizobium sp. BK491]
MTNVIANTGIITIALDKIDRNPKDVGKTRKASRNWSPISELTAIASCITSSCARPTGADASMRSPASVVALLAVF